MSNAAKAGLIIIAILALGVSWWWLCPVHESLTQRLRRECHDTLAYTHPELDAKGLDTMTKQCMDHRLLAR